MEPLSSCLYRLLFVDVRLRTLDFTTPVKGEDEDGEHKDVCAGDSGSKEGEEVEDHHRSADNNVQGEARTPFDIGKMDPLVDTFEQDWDDEELGNRVKQLTEAFMSTSMTPERMSRHFHE